MNLIHQKYLVIFNLFIINCLLSTTIVLYEHKWYAFIVFLCIPSIIYSISSVLLIFKAFCNKDINYDIKRDNISKKYLYVIPCYNESETELLETFISLSQQKVGKFDKRAMMIICDGKAIGENNNKSTDNILLSILNNKNKPIIYNYITREEYENKIDLYCGRFDNLDYILIIKHNNYGKRDSIVLARRLCYLYNQSENIHDLISTSLIKSTNLIFKLSFNNKIDYIINIDADTIFDYNCSYELIKTLENHKDNVGCVGYVDINMKKSSIFNPYNLYQYAEYMFAQCLRRQAQSHLTHKVNCLSGCVQILKVCEENCGEKILTLFNYCPKETDNIFTHIRSIASEDRNHVCLMHSIYPYARTVQTLSAIAYTNIPKSLRIFLSQRRRWSLGAITNDLLLLFSPNINIFERIASFVNVFTFTVVPFIFVATILFIKNIIIHPNILMLYLSIIMIVPFGYGLLIPIFFKRMHFKEAMYFYCSYIIFITMGFFIVLLTYAYSLLGMDSITWGKTRAIKNINKNIIKFKNIEYNDSMV
uniref:Chitin synthase n=2 Tax=viral metagenome TaxID=1070528 RepID=A0A6C0HW28_9ZZZZ